MLLLYVRACYPRPSIISLLAIAREAMQQNSLFNISPTIVSPPMLLLVLRPLCHGLHVLSGALPANPAALISNVVIEGEGWLSREMGG
jgi:hypothetical protein